ncbi:hypothetical protein JXQ70_11575 [bacterium]|nr:hypothetical protein [bacterium]
MIRSETKSRRHRSGAVTFLSIVNAVAFFITLIFWGMVYITGMVPFPGDVVNMAERGKAAVTYGFMLCDLIYSTPLLLLAWLGLWKLKSWGWLAAQMANALWLYSMTLILFRDAYTAISPGGLLFLPFALISLWALPYLWLKRQDFGMNE